MFKAVDPGAVSREIRQARNGGRGMLPRLIVAISIAGVAGGPWQSPIAVAQETGVPGVREAGSRALVNTGAMEFTLDLKTAILADLSVAGKRLVAANARPLLFATLMESTGYDGLADYAPRRFLAAQYRCEGLKIISRAGAFVAQGAGSLDFPDGDAVDFAVEVAAPHGGKRLTIGVTLTRRGRFQNRFLREIGVRLPLALAHRKRVVQAGDQGLRWDTRYCYQFHGHTSVFPYAEQNWWRHFYVDQGTDHSYHVWRAESERTSGLSAFHGRRAAGWMTLYDPDGGALVAYRELSARAPKTLYANAEAGGEQVVYLYSPTRAALDPRDPRLSAAVFGKPHEIDWIFFAGKEAEVQPDRLLARAWGVKTLPSDGPTRFAPVADEVNLWNAAASRGDKLPLVMGGLPVPKGSVKTADQVRLCVEGRQSPLQSQALAYWPDGSVKWLLLGFPLDGDGGYRFTPGKGEGREAPFRVTLRQGKDIPCVLHYGTGVHNGAVEEQDRPLVVNHGPDKVELNTGPLRLTLATGQRWLPSAVLNGVELLASDAKPQAAVDFLRVGAYAPGTTHPEGVPEPGPVQIDRVEIEDSGPLRAVVCLRGQAMCRESPRVILRVEAYKGRSFVRVSHTVEFMHNDLRRAMVRDMGLRLALAMDPAHLRAVAGGQNGPVTLKPAAAVGLRQPSHVNYEAWRLADDGAYLEIADTGHASRGWLAVSGANGGLAVVQRAMWQESPKELRLRRAGAVFEVGLWPASARLMDVRRYSEYPHVSQGEAIGGALPDPKRDPPWIEKYYSDEMEPFKGVSRSHETLLYFHPAGTSPDELDAVAADFQSQPLVYAGWPWYAGVGVTYPQVDPADQQFARVNANLRNAADWWLFHQKAWGWYGFWDFGEVRHMFRDGYGWILTPEALAKHLALPPEQRAKVRRPSGGTRDDYFTQGDWGIDNGRWGWSNTEGLINHFMSRQYLRTGRRDLFFFAEANARHARDVVARHAGRWFGNGTRHGVQPWSDGNHEERQTIFAEQRFHYLLTGEPRTRQWNRALTENYYLTGQCRGSADHSGRAYGLLFNWEITGDRRTGEIVKRYMDAFADPEGIDTSPTVDFPEAQRVARGVIHGSYARDGEMFFQSFGAMDALLEYYYLAGDQRLRDSIIKTADYGLQLYEKSRHKGMVKIKPIAFAARHAPNPAPYREALKTLGFARQIGYRYVYQQVPSNRAHWTGPTAFALGSTAYGWLNDAAYALGALEAEPPLTAEQEKVLRDLDERPVELEPRVPRESWQTEYDIPQFESFIRDPWGKDD